MSNQTRDEVVTLDALRAAAEAIPELPSHEHYNDPYAAQMWRYERARAEFWRLAFKWYHQGQFELFNESDFTEMLRIVAEVEART